ncbi:kinase-like domain-containing protein [Chytriomyces sp. MP71]|nr:kinase-like domain-containing protein [Chytriomyces sp. MP71]
MATSNAHPAPPSRYRAEFDELSCLGKGGFGIVYRARNKLDGIEYAVKKVKLSCTPTQFSLFASSTTSTNRDAVPLTLSTSFVSASTMTAGSVVSQTDARLLNEIKLFARLSQHPNVVSYHTAWIESEPDPTTPTISHIPKVLSKKCSDHSASKSRLTSSLSVLTKNTSPAASVARSTTSQLSESLKSADSEAAVRPAHPRPPATLNTADLVFARNASLLSVCSSSGHSSTNSARMPQHGTEDEFEDLIEFVAAGGGSSADESNGEDEEDSGTSDSDGDDLKCFVWTRGAGAASSAVAIAASPARKATTGKHMSASLPGRFIGSAKSHARPLVPASVSSGLATGESDVETFRASSSRLMSARTLGSSSSLRTTMKDCEESDEEVVSASEDDVVGDLSGFIAEDSAMEEEDERAAERIHKATLYIQMQLCPFMDLRTFLNKRKTASVTTPVPHVNYSVVQAVNTESESHFFHVEDVGSPNPRPSMDSYDSSDDPDYDEDNPNRNTNLLIFKQIVEGLLHIHEQQVVHRDIKPDNIFIQENMHVLVGDFGLAKSLTGHALTLYHPRPLDDSVLESDQAASTDEGTYFYMAPELIDRQVYTAKSDIYSLGIILLEL